MSKLTINNDVYVEFHANSCLVKDNQTNRVLLHKTLKDGLYQLNLPNNSTNSQVTKNPTNLHSHFIYVCPKICSVSLSFSSIFLVSTKFLVSIKDVRHKILLHPSERVLSQVIKSCSLKFLVNEKLHFCDACQFRKSHSLPFKHVVTSTKLPLELIFLTFGDLHHLFSYLVLDTILVLLMILQDLLEFVL